MAITMRDLKDLLAKEDINFYEAPDRSALLANFRGLNDSYRVVMMIELDGRFLQFRTLGWLTCPSDHPSLTEVRKAIGDETYRRRLIKIGWDPSDGEIVSYADMWLEDAVLTYQQFKRMLQNYLPATDVVCGRLKEVLESGRDPGRQSVEDMIGKTLEREGSRLPQGVRNILERLRGKDRVGSGEREREDDWV